MQEFFRQKPSSQNAEEPTKFKSQGSRNRRRSSRSRPTRKNQATVKTRQKPTSVTREPQFVPETGSFRKLSSISGPTPHTPATNSLQMVPCHISAGNTRTLTYAERMRDYIAQTLIKDNEDEGRQSSPSLSRGRSNSSSDPHHFNKYNTRLKNVSKMHSDSVPSVKRAVPCVRDALTPCKAHVETCDDSPAAKRRLFLDAGFEADLDGKTNAETVVGQVGRQNGCHPLHKLFTSSLNGKSLGPVDHYEDGLLAIANAACLMSTRVSDDLPNQTKMTQDQGWYSCYCSPFKIVNVLITGSMVAIALC